MSLRCPWSPLPLFLILQIAAWEDRCTTSLLHLLRHSLEILHIQALILLQEKLQPELLRLQSGLRVHEALLLNLHFSFFSIKNSPHLVEDLTILVAIRGICRFGFGRHVVSEFNGWPLLWHASRLSARVHAGGWHAEHLLLALLYLCFFLLAWAEKLLHLRKEGEVGLWLILWGYVLGWVWLDYSSFGWLGGVMAWMVALSCSLAEYVLRNLVWARLKPQELIPLSQTLRWSQDLDQIGAWIEVGCLDLLHWPALLDDLILIQIIPILWFSFLWRSVRRHSPSIWGWLKQTKCVEGAVPRKRLRLLWPWSHLFPAQFFRHHASVLLLHDFFQSIHQSWFNDFSFSFACDLLLEAR